MNIAKENRVEKSHTIWVFSEKKVYITLPHPVTMLKP